MPASNTEPGNGHYEDLTSANEGAVWASLPNTAAKLNGARRLQKTIKPW